MTAKTETQRRLASFLQNAEELLPVHEYGYGRITKAWMLRDKQEARAEVRVVRHRRNPFATR